MITATAPIRVIPPTSSFPVILANDIAACWWLVGRWNGNNVAYATPLGYAFRDPDQAPTLDEVRANGGYSHFPDHHPALVWARYTIEAKELYRRAG